MIDNGHSWAEIEEIAGEGAFDRYYHSLDPDLESYWSIEAIAKLDSIVQGFLAVAPITTQAGDDSVDVGEGLSWEKISDDIGSTMPGICMYVWTTFGNGRPLSEEEKTIEAEQERKRIAENEMEQAQLAEAKKRARLEEEAEKGRSRLTEVGKHKIWLAEEAEKEKSRQAAEAEKEKARLAKKKARQKSRLAKVQEAEMKRKAALRRARLVTSDDDEDDEDDEGIGVSSAIEYRVNNASTTLGSSRGLSLRLRNKHPSTSWTMHHHNKDFTHPTLADLIPTKYPRTQTTETIASVGKARALTMGDIDDSRLWRTRSRAQMQKQIDARALMEGLARKQQVEADQRQRELEKMLDGQKALKVASERRRQESRLCPISSLSMGTQLTTTDLENQDTQAPGNHLGSQTHKRQRILSGQKNHRWLQRYSTPPIAVAPLVVDLTKDTKDAESGHNTVPSYAQQISFPLRPFWAPSPNTNPYYDVLTWTAEDIKKMWSSWLQVGDNWDLISKHALQGRHSPHACQAFVMGRGFV
ncbi:hypothetical protein BGZ54_009384 [Gamsiella multidivaricata]|nr:hypothetical protein BGZ54_009384 [Gamsiella multidivaricata]